VPVEGDKTLSDMAKEGQTRLDRLLHIIDTGSTPATRKVAADQIGEVQKQHPHELYNLLRRYVDQHVYYIAIKSEITWVTNPAADAVT